MMPAGLPAPGRRLQHRRLRCRADLRSTLTRRPHARRLYATGPEFTTERRVWWRHCDSWALSQAPNKADSGPSPDGEFLDGATTPSTTTCRGEQKQPNMAGSSSPGDVGAPLSRRQRFVSYRTALVASGWSNKTTFGDAGAGALKFDGDSLRKSRLRPTSRQQRARAGHRGHRLSLIVAGALLSWLLGGSAEHRRFTGHKTAGTAERRRSPARLQAWRRAGRRASRWPYAGGFARWSGAPPGFNPAPQLKGASRRRTLGRYSVRRAGAKSPGITDRVCIKAQSALVLVVNSTASRLAAARFGF